jgi:putative transposase
MARKPRLHIPGSTYHCMLRGNDGNNIYQRKSDFSKLSLLIQEGIERYKHRILGFCFMSNHVHLVIQVAETPLSKIIQNFTFRYTRYINKKYKKIGHLFQGRFKSILVNDSQYLKELIRYIHLNPVKAGITKTPDEYFWSSQCMYLGGDPFQWVSPSRLLLKFGENMDQAINKYNSYIYKGIDEECLINFESGNQKGLDVLADDTFTTKLICAYALESTPTYTTMELLETSLKHLKESLNEVSSKSRNRKNSRIRGILAYITRETNGCSLTLLSKALNRDLSTLSESAKEIETLMNKDEALKENLNKLKTSLFKTK